MTNFWTIFSYELTRNLRRNAYLIATFGLPLLALVLILGYDAFQQARDIEPEVEEEIEELDFDEVEVAGYVDLSGVFGMDVPESLQDRLRAYATIEEARAALQADEIDIFYQITPDYVEDGKVLLHLPRLSVGLVNRTAVEQLFYETVASELDPTITNRLRNPLRLQEFNLARDAAGETESDATADFFALYAFLMVFGIGILFTNTYLMQSVIEEKENRVIEILISSVRPMHLIIGKVFALTSLGMLQIIVWVVSGYWVINLALRLPSFQNDLLTNVPLPGDSLLMPAIYFVLSYTLFAAIYAGIGTVSNSMREGPQYATLFTLPIFAPVYFLGAYQQNPDAVPMQLMSIIPLTSPTAMLMRLSVEPVPAIELAISIGLLSITVIVAMWMVGRLFRVQTLLRGNAPKLREVVQIIFTDEAGARKRKA